MLQICSNVLLLTSDSELIKEYKTLAQACDVNLREESEWNKAYRVTADRVITTPEYLEDINPSYYPNVVLILGEEETFVPYRERISFFIFDRTDSRELMFAFLKPEKTMLRCTSTDVETILKEKNVTSFTCNEYNFNFARGEFKYGRKRLYLTKGQQEYLAEWLINGHRDNKKRMVLYNLRQKFGKEFLSEFDRFGRIKEEKNENN